MSIDVRVDGDVDKALKILKKKLQKEGLLKELKLKRFYEKPSVKKKRKQMEARRRMLRRKRRQSY
jgi:small subunit ribosomal protein S21